MSSSERYIIGIAVALGIAALWNSFRLHHGYVQALADSLRSGAIAIEDSDVVDATTKRTLSDTTHALNREQLLLEIQAYRMQQQNQSLQTQLKQDDRERNLDRPKEPDH